jgi:hypothetical protein
MMKWIAASVIFLGAVVWYVKTTSRQGGADFQDDGHYTGRKPEV